MSNPYELVEITSETMEALLQEVTEMIRDIIEKNQLRELPPLVFIMHLAMNSEKPSLLMDVKQLHMGNTIEERESEVYLLGKQWGEKINEKPVMCVFFAFEAWQGTMDELVEPALQKNKKDVLHIYGVSINKLRQGKIFNVNHSRAGIMILEDDNGNGTGDEYYSMFSNTFDAFFYGYTQEVIGESQ